MNILPSTVQKLISSLERLPGLGPKSAGRIAMYLLKTSSVYKKELGKIIQNLEKDLVHCSRCFNIASHDPCDICGSSERDGSVICVVEDSLDVVAFENGADYTGKYHVLGGVISPVNGIGPEDVTIDQLLKRVKNEEVHELIIATNPNIEGEATAMFIKEEIDKIDTGNDITITRLARGLPTGADIEYADKVTIQRAFEGRTRF